jgi:hydrogenase maturation protease
LNGFLEQGSPTLRHILCFGNPLHGDDGFGPAVYQRLAALPLPPDLRLIEAGTPGLAALPLFEGCDEVVIVDALAPGETPGRVSQLASEDVMSEAALAGHGVGVGYLLQAVNALLERPPAIRILAAEAASVTPFRPGLSESVAGAVEETVTRLSVYFGRDGHG